MNLLITKEQQIPNQRKVSAFLGVQPFRMHRLRDMGGLRSALRQIWQARPETLILYVADLDLIKKPLRDKAFLFLAAPGARRILCDGFGRKESASLFRLIAVDLPRFIAALFCVPAVYLWVVWYLWRLDHASQRGSVTGPSNGPRSHVMIFRSHFFHTKFGGTLAHLHGVLDGFSANGVTVTLVATDRPIGVSSSLASIHVPPPRFLADFPDVQEFATNAVMLRSVTKMCMNSLPDILYQRHQGSTFFGLALSYKLNKPLILEFNSSDTIREDMWSERRSVLRRLRRKCEKVVLHNASLVVAVSEVLKRQAITFAGVRGDTVLVQPNGVNVERIRPDSGEGKRTVLGIEPQTLAVGFVGSFTEYMGLDCLLDAFAQISDERMRLVLVGDGGVRSRLEMHVARDSRLAERVCFTGAVGFELIPQYLPCFDVAVSPHNPPVAAENFYWSPIKLFEYMAAGRAIIASGVGQIRDILTHERTALLVPPGDVEALATAILRLRDDPDLRMRLGTNARAEAVAKHSWNQHVRNILCALDELYPIGQSGRRFDCGTQQSYSTQLNHSSDLSR